jgi:hypothetical protein
MSGPEEGVRPSMNARNTGSGNQFNKDSSPGDMINVTGAGAVWKVGQLNSELENPQSNPPRGCTG